MQPELSFTDAVRTILRGRPAGMMPQEIRENIKVRYPAYYGTESHLRNVQNGNYKDVDHAVLAQIYIACRSARDIFADKSQKPHRMSLESDAEPIEQDAEDFIEGENLEKLADDVGTLYVLGTNLYMADGIEIIKIGITTGSVDKRIAQLYTTGVPFRFRVISQWETTNYSKLEQALHCLFNRYRINKAREFFTAHCLSHIPDLIEIHGKIEQA
ncbi:GIY-YIG nuclease family protein [Pseudomonas farris]|nr:GIY-YIG nuclease family protein [Pseudomonas farris]